MDENRFWYFRCEVKNGFHKSTGSRLSHLASGFSDYFLLLAFSFLFFFYQGRSHLGIPMVIYRNLRRNAAVCTTLKVKILKCGVYVIFFFLVSIFININYVSSKNKLDLHFYKHLNTEFKFNKCHLPHNFTVFGAVFIIFTVLWNTSLLVQCLRGCGVYDSI